ncbi:phenylalanine--tRNA ligase beta subunit-related protein [Micromonospora profundi]|uniref:Phenylalanine--tRNA ligase beta subunit-related protein n=1 Tax=Micromonospora profundi TaxID=1420889 RepID=A0AAJ6HPC6_9ACTN|nr:phenylalanine--tRNA ligase beta subunit-related protein [Micromonospora profundi]WLS43727.1 phenylalanine--tRNA ligase beta subunit-related protein [Micromonospora profundi]
MQFEHSAHLRAAHPDLVAGVVQATGITATADVRQRAAGHLARARERLAGGPESTFGEIQAWRRAYTAMGLRPTQYRCASEALLRRLRLDGELPRLHPLVDLCNAVSAAYAIPVAVLDLDRVDGDLTVRPAHGDEDYLTFAGDIEHPDPGEVTYVDAAGRAHARRWVNRQSGLSAVRADTSSVLIVAEALHADAERDVTGLVAALVADLTDGWGPPVASAVLTAATPRFTVRAAGVPGEEVAPATR